MSVVPPQPTAGVESTGRQLRCLALEVHLLPWMSVAPVSMTICEDSLPVSSTSSRWTVPRMRLTRASTRSTRWGWSFRVPRTTWRRWYAMPPNTRSRSMLAGREPIPGAVLLATGLVIDFSRHLRKILQIAADRVVVEPGVVLETLNAELAPLGRRLEPVPVNARIGTVGGMISVDAAGVRSHALRIDGRPGRAASRGHGPGRDRRSWVQALARL